MLQLEGEKMAKSVGNIRSLAGALDHAGRDALILYFVSGHYRQPIAFSEELLDNAARGVARIREAGRRLVAGPSPEDMAPLKERFFAALADDFNTPEALAAVFDWVREANRRDEGTVGDADLREMLDVLALANLLDEEAAEGPDAEALGAARSSARTPARRGDYARADALRDELLERGWQVRDGSAGPELAAAVTRDRLRAQRRPRGAARPARRLARVGARRRGAGRVAQRRFGRAGARRRRRSSACAARPSTRGSAPR